MIERLSTKTNANGYTYQAEVDHDLHTVACGYFIFRRDCTFSLTVGKRELQRYVDTLVLYGYKRI